LTPMTMNPLPPQAYTKDTLTKAYMWLAHQNASIKELATTPDILVSLFLKAQRNGDEALDTPSIQNFKNELKSLAGLMGELEPSPAATAAPAGATYHQQPQQQSYQPPQPKPHVMLNKQVNIQNNHMTVDLSAQLDAKSKAMINEVREQLNLSTDLEVIRLLLSLGYNKAKSLYS
jgi:hypothetical protein